MSTTTQQAHEHISRIRRSRGLDVDGGDNMNAEDLHAALEMLSEQLYQKPTRFIMELVQNADDNSYGNQTPEISLALVGRNLHIACNETGFTRSNIDAICRIHRSTKTKDKSGEGYVGEKGIGFKSVFKVADVVWISSGHYSFKFDKRATLGMVTPIWAPFPVTARRGYTEFYLQLSADADIDGIRKELLSLQPSLLLFLRRLRRISIQVPGQPAIALACHTTPTGRKLSRNGVETEYVVHEHTVMNMPNEERRLGITNTRVLLAFPLDKHHKPIMAEQDVFAFLPIRSYGFKFLIQADFLLVASREDIDQSRPWNSTLLEGIIDAFIQTISPPMHSFLEYQWPLYLPRGIHQGTFLRSLETRISERIRSSKIIMSSAGTLEMPHNLRRIPSNFLYEEAKPMFSYDHAPYKPLSFRYSVQCFEELRRIGVDSEGFSEFVSRLTAFAKSEPVAFRQKHERWHARLAEIICKEKIGTLPQSLKATELIPLTNGNWVSSQNNTIFFGTNQSNVKIPEGLDILTVHQQAAKNDLRKKLFYALGVQDCNDVQICRTIVEKHGNMDPQDHPLSAYNIRAIAEQLHFLFTAKFDDLSYEKIWFATTAGRLVRGNLAYLDDPHACKLADYFGTYADPVSFIHDAYFARVSGPEKTSFFKWLRSTFQVSSIPRLGRYVYGRGLVMTTEFDHIIRSCSSRQVLKLIRDNWTSYSCLILPFERNSLLNDLRSMSVLCQDGQSRPLHQTYLPLKALISKVPVPQAVPFVDIPDPEDESWQHLSQLGLKTADSLAFYIDCLVGLQRKSASGVSFDSLQKMYGKIQDLLYKDPGLVTSRFREEALIYLPPRKSSQQGSWCRSADCVWAAPKCLANSSPLRSLYRSYEKLFKETLSIRNAGIQEVVQELRLLQGKGESLEEISLLLSQANKYIRCGQNKSSLAFLKPEAIFPVSSDTDGLSVALKSTLDSSWFIADFPSLKASFNGKVSLLAFAPEQCRELSPLLEALDLKHKLLSQAMEQDVQLKGDTVPSERLRQMMWTKIPHLLRLTATDKREHVRTQLARVEAYEVTAVEVNRFVQVHGPSAAPDYRVRGTSGSGGAVVKNKENAEGTDTSQLLIAVEALKPENFPPYELAIELCRLCYIEDKHIRLVDHILRQGNAALIEELLDREGIKLLKDPGNNASEESDDDEYDDFSGPGESGVAGLNLQVPAMHNTAGGSISAKGSAFDNMAGSILSVLPSLSSTESQFSAPRHPAQLERDNEVAFEGEKFIYDMLQARYEDVDPSVWTSHLRERAGHSPFTADEAEFADFTIKDTLNRLTFLLPEEDKALVLGAGNVTYHIEVKSTTGPRTSAFFMSHRQLKKARQCMFSRNSQPPKDIYVIARVFNVRTGQTKCHYYVDPWRLYIKGDLELKPPQGSYMGVPINISSTILGSDTEKSAIYFWREYDEPYGFLSQWYDCAFHHDGTTYRTAEMWMMVQKARLFGDTEIAHQMLAAPTPAKQKSLGRKVKNFDHQVWDENKVRIVEEGNWWKFTSSKEKTQLASMLLATGDRELVEASPYDRIWGIGFTLEHADHLRDDWGENLLGKAIMNVRTRLRECQH